MQRLPWVLAAASTVAVLLVLGLSGTPSKLGHLVHASGVLSSNSTDLQAVGAPEDAASSEAVGEEAEEAHEVQGNETEETAEERRTFAAARRRRRRRRWQWRADGDCTFLFFRDNSFGSTHWGWRVNSGGCDNLNGNGGRISSGTFIAGPGCTLTGYSSSNCAGSTLELAKAGSNKMEMWTTNQLGNVDWNDKIESLGCSC